MPNGKPPTPKQENKTRALVSTAQTQDQMEGRLLLDVVIGKSATVLQLLSSEDESLLVWRDTLLVLNLRLHIVDGVRRFHFESDSFAGYYRQLVSCIQKEDRK